MKDWNPIKMSQDAIAPIKVDGPPCAGCKHWRPAARTDSLGNASSARLCQAPEMFHDFSCFEDREL